jgi:hypothetical protein
VFVSADVTCRFSFENRFFNMPIKGFTDI